MECSWSYGCGVLAPSAYAERVVIKRDGRIAGEHRRRFGRNLAAMTRGHYVPVLARKPGALPCGASGRPPTTVIGRW